MGPEPQLAPERARMGSGPKPLNRSSFRRFRWSRGLWALAMADSNSERIWGVMEGRERRTWGIEGGIKGGNGGGD